MTVLAAAIFAHLSSQRPGHVAPCLDGVSHGPVDVRAQLGRPPQLQRRAERSAETRTRRFAGVVDCGSRSSANPAPSVVALAGSVAATLRNNQINK